MARGGVGQVSPQDSPQSGLSQRAPLPPSPPVEAAAPAPAPTTALAARDEVRAALLVPLSGPYAAWGVALSNAAQMALFDIADQRLNLLPIDTKGTPDGAQAALAQAQTQGADIILGPLFSAEVKAISLQTRQVHLPVLSFTTDRTALGQGVYTLGFLPESQVRRVIAFARQQGKERFALLARDDEYGRTVAEAFRTAVPAEGGQVVKVDFYDPQSRDLTGPVRRFTESDARKASGRGQAAAAPFDAVMLPDEGARLRSVASLVTYFDVDPDKVAFLGTMVWDDSRLANDPALQGGWYAVAPAEAYGEFEKRYAAAFGSRPPKAGALRASLAYDAVALAAVLTRQKQDFSDAVLTNPNGFAGIDGLFRLRADGGNDRGLAVRQVDHGTMREVGAAPPSFPALAPSVLPAPAM